MRGERLEPKGPLIAGLRQDNELLVAEVVDRGVLNDTSLAEVASLCSCLLEESRSGDPVVARTFLKHHPRLRKKLNQAGIVEESFGGHEGDLIRAMRRLIDLLCQLAESSEVPPSVTALLGRASRAIDRVIALESALI